MINIAILGFGVVGGGVADLLTKNKNEVTKISGEEINIKYILDIRDFPDSPFGYKVIRDYEKIVNDPEISVVLEVMGGSHPAYEYTVAALKAGKSVITSNKEVVANFGDEFLALAKENNVVYRFEASVGGGIPVISPIISCVRHNKVSEVRGILNGTTNYILTQMFTYGKSFDTALRDAQQKGYAESNPDADILGTDACRKTVILTALVSGKLANTAVVHTEGIVGIRDNDVRNANAIGSTIKLVGRGIIKNDKPLLMVTPFIVSSESALSEVSGVYNAVEVIAQPLGNVMFYGQGAGAGATASAVVSDLLETIVTKTNYSVPIFEKCDDFAPFDEFSSKHYLALTKEDYNKVSSLLGEVTLISNSDEIAFITRDITEKELNVLLAGVKPLSHIRVLK